MELWSNTRHNRRFLCFSNTRSYIRHLKCIQKIFNLFKRYHEAFFKRFDGFAMILCFAMWNQRSRCSIFDRISLQKHSPLWHAQLNRYYIKISIPSISFFISLLLPFLFSLFLCFSRFPTVFLFLESRNYDLPQCVVRYSGNHEWIRQEFLAFKIQKKRTMKKRYETTAVHYCYNAFLSLQRRFSFSLYKPHAYFYFLFFCLPFNSLSLSFAIITLWDQSARTVIANICCYPLLLSPTSKNTL